MKFLFILLLLIPFGSSAQKITDPVEYYKLLELIQYTASNQIYAISVMANEKETTPENLQEYRSLLIATFRQVILDLDETGGFEGNDDLNKTTRELVEFYEKMVTDHYDEYVQFFLNKNNTEDPKLMEIIAALVSEEAKLRTAYFEAQQAFATKSGIEAEE